MKDSMATMNTILFMREQRMREVKEPIADLQTWAFRNEGEMRAVTEDSALTGFSAMEADAIGEIVDHVADNINTLMEAVRELRARTQIGESVPAVMSLMWARRLSSPTFPQSSATIIRESRS